MPQVMPSLSLRAPIQARVNDLMRRFRSVPRLSRHGTEPWHLHYHGEQASFVEGWAAGGAASLAVLIGSPDSDRVGVCTAGACVCGATTCANGQRCLATGACG